MNYHKLLEKQIQKLFPNNQELPENCLPLFELISDSYSTFEKHEINSENVYSLSERENQKTFQNLEIHYEIHKKTILRLKDAIAALDTTSLLPLNHQADDLMEAILLLEKQIQKSKELESELIRAKELAEKASNAKSDFLSVMSHEIRTPLNAIIGIAHLMMNDELPLSQMENMRTLNISAENLLNLINDILDFNKIEEGKILLSEKNTDLVQLVNHIKLANRIRAEERGNILRVVMDNRLPRFVIADDIRLGQILNNLVSNAIKFTRNGAVTIDVSLVNLIEDEVEVLFAVTDTGIGIEKNKQQLIFDHFSQADSEITREYGGSGLGLTIIKRLLKLMNSDVLVESEIGLGSRFFFTLTLKKGQEMAIIENLKNGYAKNSLDGIRVLLVEDVEFNVMVAQKMLLNWNAKVDVAENGLNAIGKAKEGNYDIILMDLQMPVLDGYSATRHIREFNLVIPIIALTASASTDVHQKTKEAGMNGYVSKPFKPADLYDAIYRFTQLPKAS